jgi:PAS domain-containing protein
MRLVFFSITCLLLSFSVIFKIIEVIVQENINLAKNLEEHKHRKKVQEEFMHIFESLPEAIVVLQNEQIFFMNKIFKQIIGIQA